MTKCSDTVALFGLTDQTTTRLHKLLKSRPRSRDTLAKSRLADIEHGSALSAAQLKDFTQNIGKSVLAVKAKQHSQRATELEISDKQSLLYVILTLKHTIHV